MQISAALVPTAAPVSAAGLQANKTRRRQRDENADCYNRGYFPGVAEKIPAVCLARWRRRRRYTKEAQCQRPSGALIGFLLKVHINQAGWVGELGGGGRGGSDGRGLRPALPSYKSLIKSLSVFSGGVECCR